MKSTFIFIQYILKKKKKRFILILGLLFLLFFNSDSKLIVTKAIHEFSYLINFSSSLLSFTLPFHLLSPTSYFTFPKYFSFKSKNGLNSEAYCSLPTNQLLNNNWINSTNDSLDTTSVYNSLTSNSICDRKGNDNVHINKLEETNQLLDFETILKKLDHLQGSLGQLDKKYNSLSNLINMNKKNNKMIKYTLEGFSLEIYSLYKKINYLEDRLMSIIQAKSKALDYQYKKSLEREERILKILYDHMAQLYDGQIEFIRQVNSLLSNIEKSQQQKQEQKDKIYKQYMKQKYLMLQQQMNKYKMMLTIFELPLNLLVHKDSFPYFEDFLNFIKNESITLGQYIDTLEKLDHSTPVINDKNKCPWGSPFENLVHTMDCSLNHPINHQNSSSILPHHSNESNVLYELYEIYHEKFIKLKQMNMKEHKENHQLFSEMSEMRQQLEYIHSIINTLKINQIKLENKFKSIEHILTFSTKSPLSSSSSKNMIMNNRNWICPYLSPDFYNLQLILSNSDQCPVFYNEFVDLVYQYVIKKIKETDYGIDRPDYALKTSGGYILHSYTSPSYKGEMNYEVMKDKENSNNNNNNNSKDSFIKTLLLKYLMVGTGYTPYPSPDLILDPHILPGYNWVMKGSSGYITIGLAKPIYPKSITIDHLSPNLNLESSMSSAPKYIEVIGIYNIHKFKPNTIKNKERRVIFNSNHKNSDNDENDNDNEIILIPVFEFNPSTSPSSSLTIPVPENIYSRIKKPIKYLHINILSNWGNNKYTSIYRIRIH